jgi:hypothetical protein
VSHVDHAFEGTGYFTGLYDDDSSLERVINDCLSRDPGSCFEANKQFTRQLLCAPTLKKKYASSQTIWNQAYTACVSAKRHWHLPRFILPKMEENLLLATPKLIITTIFSGPNVVGGTKGAKREDGRRWEDKCGKNKT